MTTQTRTSTKRMPREMPELKVWIDDDDASNYATYKRGIGFLFYFGNKYTATFDTIQECRQERDAIVFDQLRRA